MTKDKKCAELFPGKYLSPYNAEQKNFHLHHGAIQQKKTLRSLFFLTRDANPVFTAFFCLVQRNVCLVEQFGEGLNGAVCVVGDADACG